jgi:riboflavin kinase / FMN adenylyltransferase
METYDGSDKLGDRARGCVMTIGNFDGLHLGHRALLDAVVERAGALGRPAAVYTFDRHPRRVLQPDAHLPRLMSRAQMEHGLREAGIDILIVEPFTRELADLEPAQFVEQVLVARIAPTELFVGRDFRFGHGRAGSDETLRRLLPASGVRVSVISQVLVEGEDVSSTRIRRLLEQGSVEEVSRCLGRPYALWGHVVEGDRRGRTLGFPTANLAPENELIPARGVYATSVQRVENGAPGGAVHPAVTNVGTRPTFEPGRLLVESHLLDFDGDLYGARISVAFHARIREERRFSGADELRAQIRRDAAHARALLTQAR